MKIEYYDKEEQISALIEHHNRNQSKVVIDLETTGLDRFTDRILQIGMTGYEPDSAVVFDAPHVHLLKNLCATIIFHNFKFDCTFLRDAGVDIVVNNCIRDTMLMHHLYDENASHSLGNIVKDFYKDDYKDEFWNDKTTKYETKTLEEKVTYCGTDVIYTMRVYNTLSSSLDDSLVNHVHRLALALFETEYRGIKVDFDYLSQINDDLIYKIEVAKIKLGELAVDAVKAVESTMLIKLRAKFKTPQKRASCKAPPFNWDSSHQLKELFYKHLNLPIQYHKRKVTTNDAALQALSQNHPIIPVLREYRKLQKVKGSFIDGTLEKQHNGRVFPEFKVNGTVTGRISSANPNLQQLPRQGGIRGIYIPEYGHRFLCADYQQLEICLAAHFSNDPVLIDIINSGKSVHDNTAKALKIDRQTAKNINFAVIYGAQVPKIAKMLKCNTTQAQKYLDLLWGEYSGLKSIIETCHRKVEKGIPLQNPFGRLRRFPKGLYGYELEAAKRQAFNSLVQGTGADITHQAFYRLSKELHMIAAKALFEVHDEIVAEIPNEPNNFDLYSGMMHDIMVDVGKTINLKVPLSVTVSHPMERWEKA